MTAWDEAFERFCAAGGSNGRLYFADPYLIAEADAAMARGDPLGRRLVGVCRDFLARIIAAAGPPDGSRAAHDAPLCLTCDAVLATRAAGRRTRLRLPTVIVVGLPPGAAPDTVLAAGVCRRCAAAARWPQPGWRDRLAERLLPVFRDAFSDDDLVIIEPAALAAAGAA